MVDRVRIVRAVLMNGIPVGLIAELLQKGFRIEFVLRNKEWLEEILNTSLEIVNSIRHESTKNLVLSLLWDKSKVVEKPLIELSDLVDADYIIVVAPKSVQRGQEMNVSWEDLIILQIGLIGLAGLYE